MTDKHITHEELEKILDAWGMVKLRLREHEEFIRAGADSTTLFVSRGRLLKAITAWKESP